MGVLKEICGGRNHLERLIYCKNNYNDKLCQENPVNKDCFISTNKDADAREINDAYFECIKKFPKHHPPFCYYLKNEYKKLRKASKKLGIKNFLRLLGNKDKNAFNIDKKGRLKKICGGRNPSERMKFCKNSKW